MCGIVKNALKIDDSLDVFAVHGVGGAMGTLLTAIFGTVALGGLGLSDMTMGGQFGVQLTGVIATLVWSGVATLIIAKILQATVGLRASQGRPRFVNGGGARPFDITKRALHGQVRLPVHFGRAERLKTRRLRFFRTAHGERRDYGACRSVGPGPQDRLAAVT